MMRALPRRIEDVPLGVRADGLVKRFGRVTALDGLDLTIPEGSFYVLVGENAAGKSTLLRTYLDLVRPDAGTATSPPSSASAPTPSPGTSRRSTASSASAPERSSPRTSGRASKSTSSCG